jgi:hypothetical protein
MRRPIALLPVLMVVLVTCKPDKKVQPAPVYPVDGRAKFVGTYDVYDTIGNYEYTMEISLHPGALIDSLFIQNWNGAFDVYCQQDADVHTDLLNFDGDFGISDHQGRRWALFREYDTVFQHNLLRNDTLHMAYFKNNIAFYVADGVPYFAQSYREYAVKRDWE